MTCTLKIAHVQMQSDVSYFPNIFLKAYLVLHSFFGQQRNNLNSDFCNFYTMDVSANKVCKYDQIIFILDKLERCCDKDEKTLT